MESSPTASSSSVLEMATMELKQQRDRGGSKSLKHKSKNKRASPTSATGGKGGNVGIGSGGGSPNMHHHLHHYRPGKGSGGAGKEEEKMRELLTTKIAELEVGGDENLETPIDLSGIYADETLASQVVAAMQHVLEDEAMTSEDKTQQLAKQLTTASEQLTLLQKKIKEIHARCIVLKQRKHAVSSELLKMGTTKGKLEQLCRELQKQNKLIVSESRRIAEEEDQKRRELSAQFQTTIEEVSAKMDQQGKDYMASLKENEALHAKLQSIVDQYAVREEHFKRQLETKDLTIQLAEAKLDHQVELTSRETEKVKLTMERAQVLTSREDELQSQLNAYAEKFDVVQETLAKSNEMFTTFRSEMDKLSKHTKKLEKENAGLKKKCDEYDRGAISAIQENVKVREETQRLQEKIKKLESLCRTLQAQNKSLREEQEKTDTSP